MSRFYAPPASVRGKKIYVSGEEAHHITEVMRLGCGDPVTVFDGTGAEYDGVIASSGRKKVVIDVLDARPAGGEKRTAGLSLAQAVPKKDKMDLIAREATELGAEEIIPFESARTVARIKGERRRRRPERWRRIAVEASKQCGRSELPRISEIKDFAGILRLIPEYDIAIMPCLSKKAVLLKSALRGIRRPKKTLAIIGPEGGFTEDEVTTAERKGAVLVSLGPLTLKSDTAAVVTLSILNNELG